MGQLIFHSSLLYTLIDFDATYSFVASGIKKKIRLKPILVSQVSIEISNRDKVHNKYIWIGETTSLGGKKLVVNLIVMDMLNFGLILGMDFLRKYRVEINCRKKKV